MHPHGIEATHPWKENSMSWLTNLPPLIAHNRRNDKCGQKINTVKGRRANNLGSDLKKSCKIPIEV